MGVGSIIIIFIHGLYITLHGGGAGSKNASQSPEVFEFFRPIFFK